MLIPEWPTVSKVVDPIPISLCYGGDRNLCFDWVFIFALFLGVFSDISVQYHRRNILKKAEQWWSTKPDLKKEKDIAKRSFCAIVWMEIWHQYLSWNNEKYCFSNTEDATWLS